MKSKKSKKFIRFIIFITIIAAAVAAVAWLTSKKVEAAWYNDSWGSREKITIDHTKVSGGSDLTSFPVLISFTDLKLRAAQSTGNDILFTSSDGSTKLDHEIEKFTQSTGTLVAWVRIPTLSASTDTPIYMYYGNSGAADQSNKTGVWDANYVSVWHLKETSGHQTDSKSTHDSTSEAADVQGSATGIANGADQFNGVANHMITIPGTGLDLATDFTMEVWVNPTSVTGTKRILEKCIDAGCGTAPRSTYEIQLNNQACFITNRVGGDGSSQCSNTLTPGQWYYLASVIQSGGQGTILYQNGASVSTAGGATGNILTSSQPVNFGDSGDSDPYNGILDEVRFSNIRRPAGWIATTYNTISSPATFYSLGAIERTKQPVMYWKLDDGTGTTAKDSTPNNNVGALGGTTVPTWQTEDQCVSGKCLYFDGITSKVTASVITKSMQTISFWIRPNIIASQGLVNLDGGTHKINTNDSGVISAVGFTSPTIYVNGIVTSTLTANVWQLVSITTGTSFDTTSSWTLGTDGTNFLKGFFDDVKLYDYARTAAQVKADFNSKSAAAAKGASVILGAQTTDALNKGLIGYWKMDDKVSGDNKTLVDSSGNGNSGTTHYGANTTGMDCTTSGKFGTGCTFDGVDDYATVPSNSIFNLTSSYTISAWVYSSTMSSLGTSDIVGRNAYFDLRTDYSQTGDIGLFDTNGNGSRTNNTFSNNAWHHIVAVQGGAATSTIQIYVDGIAQPVTTRGGAWAPTGSGNNVVAFANIPSSGNGYFPGTIDEVRIYNRALSPAEVQQLYNFAPGPIAYYKLDEGNALTGQTGAVLDSSGNGFNATWVGTGATHYVPGKYGKAANFNGTDDWANAGNISSKLNLASASPPSFTVSAWFNVNSGTPDLGGIGLMCVGGPDCTGNNNGVSQTTRLFYHINKLDFQLKNGSTQALSLANITFGTWIYATGVYDSAANKIYLYQNGVLQQAQTPADINLSTYTHRLAIGVSGGLLKGQLDDVKVYNYARTQSQILQDMGNGPAERQPVGYWKFDEGYGTITNDSSGNGNTMTLAGSTKPSWTNAGKYGKALSFGGTNAYLAAGSNVATFKQTSDLSLSAWINLTNTSSQHDIICKYTGTALTSAYCLNVSSAGKLVMQVTNATGPANVTTTGNTTLLASTWYHVVGVFSNASSVTLYINGIQDKQATTSIPTTLQNPTTILDIGGENVGTANLMNGTIDEAKVYNYALTPADIQTDYNQSRSEVLGVLGNNASYTAQAANQQYCVPGDPSACSGPVGEWKFEEGTGTTANDSSGNNLTGTLVAATWVPGKFGSGVNFNSASQIISIPGFTPPSTLTYETWFYARSDGANSLGRFVEHNNFIVFFSSGSIFFNAEWTGEGGWYITQPSYNAWHHLVITYSFSSTSNTPLFYIDGLPQTVTLNATPTGSITLGSATLRLGNRNTSDRSFDGVLDDTRIYNYARTPAQIAYDFNRGAPVAWWKFDECQGSVANDASGNGNVGTITIGATGTQTSAGTCSTASTAWGNGAIGKYNSSLNFDGTDDVVTVANSIGTQSVSFWAYPTSTSQSFLQLTSSANVTSSSGVVSATGFTSPTIYVNGLVNGKITANTWNHIVVTTGTSISANAFKFGLVGSTYYSGQLDDARVYNYALTTTQVQQVYNQDAAVRFGPVTGSP